jgi:3-oxoacyl-[acyl-carrier-protein] synthase II
MSERVVITGIGPVSSLGIGKTDFFEKLYLKESCIVPIPEKFLEHYNFRSRFLVPRPEFDLSDYGIPGMYNTAMQAEDKMAVLGAFLAFEDAGFKLNAGRKKISVEGIPEETSVIMGTGFSGLENAFNSFSAHANGPDSDCKSPEGKKQRFQRMIIPMMMPNSVSAWISILFGLQGSSHTLNASCASGTYAVGEAFRSIHEGRAQLVLTGGVENLKDQHGAIMRGFDMLGALTRSEDGYPIPFSKRRSGFLFCEGAGCVLVMEEYRHALERGADIYAEVVDYKANSDAFNIVQMKPSGEKIAELLGGLKGDNQIDYLNTHGTGTGPNDEIEAAAIQRIFGNPDSQPLINSTKGIAGHSIGASGALEAAVAAMAIKTDRIHGLSVPDPLDSLNIAGETQSHPVHYAMSVSYGFGGHNGGLLFQKAGNGR